MMKRKRKSEAATEAEEQPRDEAADGQPERAQDAPEQDGDTDEAAEEPSIEQQLAETHERLLRKAAELDNARRRARLDVEEARKYGQVPLLTELLEVMDALQRALANAGSEEDPLVEGLRLTEQQFSAVLSKHGVTPVPSEPGQATDPGLHRVLVEQPGTDHEPGAIVTEITRGYRLHDRLLREAQVVVAARPAEGAATEPAPEQEPDDADV